MYLMCESSDYPPSSLSIVKKYSKDILDTSVVDGVLVYHIKSVQCSHMGIYVCFYNNNTSQNSTLDVGVEDCLHPQLCYEEKKTRTVIAALYDNVSIEVCVITWKWSSLVLDSVFRHDNRKDKLLENRYESSLISTKSTDLSHWKVNVTLRDIQEIDFGKISIKLCDSRNFWEESCLIYEMILVKQEIELKIYESKLPVPVDELFDGGESLQLRCESGGYQPTSLSISKLYSKEILHAPVFDRNLVYRFENERLLCSDMGTYVCFHKNGASKNATVNVPVIYCPPQLCHVESRTRIIYASVNDNVTVDICVISLKIPILTSVSRNGNTTDKTLLKSRYEDSSIVPMASQGLYWKVNLVLRDLQEEDFGSISVDIDSMIYSIVLARKESEDDSLPIYVVSACLTGVALILVAVAIFICIKTRPKKSSSRTPAPYYVNELNDGQPAASQQLLRRFVPRYNEITDRQPSSSQQIQAIIQDGGNGYLDVVPGPIYPEPCHIYEVVGPPTASKQLLRHSVPRDENEIIDRQPASSQQMQATIQDGGDGYLDVVPGPIIYPEPKHENVGQPTASQQMLRHSVPGDEDEFTDCQPSSSQEMQAMIQDREDGYLEPGPIYESID